MSLALLKPIHSKNSTSLAGKPYFSPHSIAVEVTLLDIACEGIILEEVGGSRCMHFAGPRFGGLHTSSLS